MAKPFLNRQFVGLPCGPDQAARCRYRMVRILFALLGIGVVMALWASQPPSLVSADGISVLVDHQEVDIPDGVVFDIAAEAESDIVEIQLWYRTTGQEIWSDRSLDFIPGQHVTASLKLNLSDPEYLPPGAELEYYYVIRNADGNVKQTPPKVIEYLDAQFHWDRTQAGPLLLVHHDIGKTEVVRVVREVEEALNSIGSLLRVGNPRPMKGVIYNTDAEAQEALPGQGQAAVANEQVFGGFSFPSSGVFVALGFQSTIIVHEATHLLLNQAVGTKALSLPSWLDEGIANYKMPPEWKRFSGSSISSQGSPLIEMTRVPEAASSIATFYQKSESIVAYLIKEYGTDSFQQLIAHLAEGRTTEDALLRSHGFGIAELEARWSQDNRWPPAPVSGTTTGGPAWQDFIPVAIAVLAIVVLLIVMSAKHRPAAYSEASISAASISALNIDPSFRAPEVRSAITTYGFLTMWERILGDSQRRLLLLFSVGAAILVIIGSVNSWADVRNESYVGNQIRMVSVTGTDADGYVTLVAGVIALILVLMRLAMRHSNWLVLGGALALFLISGIIGVTNLMDLSASIGAFSSSNLPSLGGAFLRTDVGVGWGLIVVTVASWAGLTSAAYQFWQDHRL